MHIFLCTALLLTSMARPAELSLADRRAAVKHYEAGKSAKRAGEFERAQQLLHQAAQLDPQWGAPRLELAAVLRTIGAETEQRRSLLRKTRQLLPKNPRVHYESALFKRHCGERQAAIDHLKRALDLRRDYDEAHFALAQLTEEIGQYEQALALYTSFLATHRHHAGAYFGIAECARHLNKPAEEERALLHLVRLAPRNPIGYLRMARFYRRMGVSGRAQEFMAIANSLVKREAPRQMRPLLRSIK